MNSVASQPEVVVSLFESFDKPQVAAKKPGSWASFVAGLRTPLPRDVEKKALPLWAPTEFLQDYRNDFTVLRVHALTLDVDVEPVPGATDLRAALAGLRAFAHTSSSSTAASPLWRVGIALSRAVTGDEYRALWSRVTASLPFPVGEQSKNPSRQWFMPREGSDGSFEFLTFDGEPLDVDAILADEVPAPKASSVQPVAQPSSAASPLVLPANLPVSTTPSSAPRADRLRRRDVATRMLGEAWAAKGHRHAAQRALAGGLCRDGYGEAAAVEVLCDVCRIAGDEDRPKREATVRDTFRRAAAGEPYDAWSALERCIDPVVVDAARRLLDPCADEARDFMSLVAAKAPAANDDAAKPKAAGLNFTFGAWDVEPAPTEFVVDGLIPRGAVIMFYGRADSLKTWVLFHMACAMTNGQPWLARPTRKVRVGIVDFETGAGNLRRRLYMLRAGANENLGAVCFSALKPSQREFWIELAKADLDVVIIDSLRRSNPGANENDSAEAILPLELAMEFSELTGCTVIFIHHAKKSSEDGWPEFRGSAAIEDQVDAHFAVRKVDVSATKKRVEIRCGKPGDMPTPAPFAIDVTFDDVAKVCTMAPAAEEARPKPESEVGDDEIRAGIRLALANGPLATKRKIKDHVRGERQVVYAEIDAMKATGEIALITDVGYVLDSPAARRARVFEEVRRSDRWTSSAKLAKAAFVPAPFVERLLHDGVIAPRATGGEVGGFIVVARGEDE